MIGFGAPTPPTAGGSGGPAVDSTARALAAAAQATADDALAAAENPVDTAARAAATAAQADATAALEGDAVDLAARDAAADALAAAAALGPRAIRSIAALTRTTSTAYAGSNVEASGLQNVSLSEYGESIFTLSANKLTVKAGVGAAFLKVDISETLNGVTASIGFTVRLNGSATTTVFRNYSSAQYDSAFATLNLLVTEGDVIDLIYATSVGFTSVVAAAPNQNIPITIMVF